TPGSKYCQSARSPLADDKRREWPRTEGSISSRPALHTFPPPLRLRVFAIPNPSAESEAVVRCLARDGHRVRVGFAQAAAGDAYELRLRPQLVDRGAAEVPHPRAQAADQLVDG